MFIVTVIKIKNLIVTVLEGRWVITGLKLNLDDVSGHGSIVCVFVVLLELEFSDERLSVLLC